jgi:hypothetical protein
MSIVVYNILSDVTTTKMSDEDKLTSLVFNYRSQYDKTDRFYDNNSAFGITRGRRLLD